MQAVCETLHFDFKFPAGTSRGVLHQKTSTMIYLHQDGKTGVGECSTIPGLSPDPEENYIGKIQEICNLINNGALSDNVNVQGFPSIMFGLETALHDLKSGGKGILFPSDFTRGKAGIPINGLIWMGEKAFMQEQIQSKLEAGYRCLKMKVGALDFETELQILQDIRARFAPEELEIRVDANGAFTPQDAMKKIDRLSAFCIHSIEQPIKPGQLKVMEALCRNSSIPVALDEELIGFNPDNAISLISDIKPAYIILKPSLLGGFKIAQKWIDAAESNQTGWWVTSALESNIGLNAIAQWTYTLNNPLPQGLGTGQLYRNNIPSPLEIRGAELWFMNY